MTSKGSIAHLLLETMNKFQAAGVTNPQQEAQWLLAWCSGLEVGKLLVSLHKELSEEGLRRLEACIEERIAHKPLAYIVGSAEFYGYQFEVNSHTLIPRLDSEVVVETVVKSLTEGGDGRADENRQRLGIVDLGCGTGCLSIASTKELFNAGLPVDELLLLDISVDALEVAKRNANKLLSGTNDADDFDGVGDEKGSPRLRFVNSDFTEPSLVKLMENFAQNLCVSSQASSQPLAPARIVIISNPPYLTAEQMAQAHQSLGFEPETALFGGHDGMYFYRKIIGHLERLKSGKWGGSFCNLILEIDPDLTALVTEELTHAGFDDVTVLTDAEHRNRALLVNMQSCPKAKTPTPTLTPKGGPCDGLEI